MSNNTETLRAANATLNREKSTLEVQMKPLSELSDSIPDRCPVTGRPFFMSINHPDLGMVPTYGGPYDSYTLPERDEYDEYFVHRYDHDEGAWVDDEAVYIHEQEASHG